MTTPTINSVVRILEKLPASQQKQAVARLQSYLLGRSRTAPAKGQAGKSMLKFAGMIPPRDLKQIEKAIEAGFEQVDGNKW